VLLLFTFLIYFVFFDVVLSQLYVFFFLTLCVGGGDSTNLNWEMPSAIFFVTTIVTTIGYGTFAPGTDAGKTFTVIFAFIGIGKCPLLGVGVPSDFFFD
jgi:hypothetical protein